MEEGEIGRSYCRFLLGCRRVGIGSVRCEARGQSWLLLWLWDEGLAHSIRAGFRNGLLLMERGGGAGQRSGLGVLLPLPLLLLCCCAVRGKGQERSDEVAAMIQLFNHDHAN